MVNNCHETFHQRIFISVILTVETFYANYRREESQAFSRRLSQAEIAARKSSSARHRRSCDARGSFYDNLSLSLRTLFPCFESVLHINQTVREYSEYSARDSRNAACTSIPTEDISIFTKIIE